jgi:hypothetical protein
MYSWNIANFHQMKVKSAAVFIDMNKIDFGVVSSTPSSLNITEMTAHSYFIW